MGDWMLICEGNTKPIECNNDHALYVSVLDLAVRMRQRPTTNPLACLLVNNISGVTFQLSKWCDVHFGHSPLIWVQKDFQLGTVQVLRVNAWWMAGAGQVCEFKGTSGDCAKYIMDTYSRTPTGVGLMYELVSNTGGCVNCKALPEGFHAKLTE